jgi:hypothetical protein
MNASSIDIKDILVANVSLGLVFVENLFIGKEPPTPKDCVTIYDTPGFPAKLTIKGQGENYYYPSVMIRIRNHNYVDGWNLAHDIMVALHGLNNISVGDTLYTVIACANSPTLLDWDENNNARFIINFNLQRRSG